MPVVFNRYLKWKSDEDAAEQADDDEAGARTSVDRGKAGPRLRRFALGVAVGAVVGWLLGRKGTESESTGES